MAKKLNPDTVLQLFISENEAYNSCKSKLFRKQHMLEKLSIREIDEDIGISVQVETEEEFYNRETWERPASYFDHINYYKVASPTKPTRFTNQTQEFPLQETVKFQTCHKCNGRKEITCTNCHGSGEVDCSTCGGDGDCNWCHGSGKENCSCINDDDCPWCHGRGYTDCSHCFNGNCRSCNGSGNQTCSTCHGSGNITCPTCSGEGELLTFDVDIYSYKHLTRERSVYDNLPKEVAVKFQSCKNKKGMYFELEELTEEAVEAQLGFINGEVKERIDEGKTIQKGLYSMIRTMGGKMLFSRDRFRIVPTNHTVIDYSDGKTPTSTYWSLGTITNPTEYTFNLPKHPGKILNFIIFLLAAIATIPVFLYYWKPGEIYNLQIFSYLKFIPPFIEIMTLIIILIQIAKGRRFRNIVILGLNNKINVTYFMFGALFFKLAGYGEINDKYLFKHNLEDLLQRKYFSPGISLTYTVQPNKSKRKIKNPLKILALNAQSFSNSNNPKLKELRKITDRYVVLVTHNDYEEIDKITEKYFEQILLTKKKGQVKISFVDLESKKDRLEDIKLSSLLPKTFQILDENKHKFHYRQQVINLAELSSKFKEENLAPLEKIVEPMLNI